jgi:dipeptidyl aminopeptidase/acylaminoacyl peptidase
VSALAAAAKITVPVFLIHGDADVETPPNHSRRVFAALRGPKRLLLVPGAPHNGSLRSEVWDEIERWIDTVVPPSERRSLSQKVSEWRPLPGRTRDTY